MAYASLDLVIDQASLFTLGPITYQDATGTAYDITGYAARMMVRTAPGGDVIASSANGDITFTLGGTAGTITASISALVTSALEPGSYVYDLYLDPSGSVGANSIRLLQGNVVITPTVTE